MSQKLIYFFIAVVIIAGLIITFSFERPGLDEGPVACTMDAMICPDGTTVGRTGPNCEFAACPAPQNQNLPGDIEEYIESKADLIRLTSPQPLAMVNSPLLIEGEARGYWFFEASFPVVLVNWDGLIIAEGIATADGEWMTEEFVPFTAELVFENSFAPSTPDFMKRGAIIMQKDNPSGLPENDDALEVPIIFE